MQDSGSCDPGSIPSGVTDETYTERASPSEALLCSHSFSSAGILINMSPSQGGKIEKQ